MGFAILNIPGETRADVMKTIDLVRRADPDFLQVSFLTPYPGTALREAAEADGAVTTSDWSRYSFLNDVVLKNPAMDADEVRALHGKLLRGFYLRPRTAWKLARLLIRGTSRPGPLLRTVALGIAGLVRRLPAGHDRGGKPR